MGPPARKPAGLRMTTYEWSLAMVGDRADTEFRAHKVYDVWGYVFWRLDLENGAVRYWLQGNRLPRRSVGRLMQDYRIRAVENFLR